jgi:hypothetical protein
LLGLCSVTNLGKSGSELLGERGHPGARPEAPDDLDKDSSFSRKRNVYRLGRTEERDRVMESDHQDGEAVNQLSRLVPLRG